MNIRYRTLAIMIAATLLAKISFAETATAAPAQPVAFEWSYKYEPDSGKRSWVFSNQVWTETRASGKKVKYQTMERTVFHQYNVDFRGVVVRRTDEPAFEVFIPDLDNKFVWIFFRRDKGEWQFLSGIPGAH